MIFDIAEILYVYKKEILELEVLLVFLFELFDVSLDFSVGGILA